MRGGTRRLGTGTRATQASPPTSSATPAPTGTKALPKRHDKKPPPEGGSGVDVGWGRLRRPGRREKARGGAGRGRRKRPHPTHHPPPPLRQNGVSSSFT